MLNFCTLFDKNYLPQGLSLWSSLSHHHKNDFSLFVLCLDETTYYYFTNNSLKNIVPIRLTDLEESDQQLSDAKKNRSVVEYYFTLSPCLPLYILKTFPEVEWICSLDADIYFFSDPQPIFDQFKDYSILICPHKFTHELIATGIEKYGIYNVSFQAFKKDDNGIRCLELWRKECIEWCYDRYDAENGRFADQKYLDKWKNIFPGRVMELNGHTSGLAPWNLNNYNISFTNQQVLSNHEPLIFYHFHGLKRINSKWFANAFNQYNLKNSEAISFHIYLPYIKELDNWSDRLNIEIDSNKRYEKKKKSLYRKLSRAGSLFKWKKPDKLDFIKMHWLQKIRLLVQKH